MNLFASIFTFLLIAPTLSFHLGYRGKILKNHNRIDAKVTFSQYGIEYFFHYPVSNIKSEK